MRRKNLLAALLLIGVSVSASAAYVLVQARGKASPGDPIVYSIKFLCGFVTPQTEARLGLKPANYETDIDIHNPDTVGVVKVAQKKFVLSVPEPAPGGIVQSPRTVVRGFILPADMAVDITCADIYSHLRITPPFPIKGYVVLLNVNSTRLDVTAIYTAESHADPSSLASPTTGMTMDVETVRAKKVP